MMISALFLAASLAGQAPAPSGLGPKTARAAAAATPKAKATAAAKPAMKARVMTAKERAAAERAALMAKRKARSRARSAADARADVAASRNQAQLEAQYLKMLPLLQNQQRIDMEGQRAALAQMNEQQRLAALNRMVGAMERSAGYIYPGQSPSVGPFAQPSTVAPMNPLYSRLIPE
jgi:ATPase subunit of ABC transporter with duplicated ATPase domains